MNSEEMILARLKSMEDLLTTLSGVILANLDKDRVEINMSAKGLLQPSIKIHSDNLQDPNQAKALADGFANTVTELKKRFPDLQITQNG